VVLGVDGLDYIQGIPLKLLAFERFLEQHPQMVKEVVLVQVRGGFVCLCGLF
jgi:trehalose-6-phosphate synthase